MNKTKIAIGIIILAAAGVLLVTLNGRDSAPIVHGGKSDLIQLSSPKPGEAVKSPINITGEARGNWYFEANFPIYLTDWDGKIIAEGYATAQGDWMTSEFVPFTAVLSYNADVAGGYSNKGTLVLKKANASGLPENDDALEIPVILN